MKNTKLYFAHILECIKRIELYTKKGKREFLKNIQVQDSVYRNFEIIGEASKRIPATTKSKAPGVPWKNIAGFRDILIHQYDGIDPSEVWDTIKEHLPKLKKAIKKLMSDTK